MTRHHGSIPKQRPKKCGAIPDPPVQESTDKLPPTFRFTHADDKGQYALRHWVAGDLDDLISCFKRMEQMSWEEIRATGGPLGQRTGLAYQRIKNPKSLGLSPEVKPFEVRPCERKRLIAFRDGQVCYIMRFDRNHTTTNK